MSFEVAEKFAIASTIGMQKYPRTSSKSLLYGTAGFRDIASELSHVMYRMGLLAVLRSKLLNGSTVGLMITASHNPEEDNGVKLCDPDGKMLEKDWEEIATTLVNAEDGIIAEYLSQIVHLYNISEEISANVFVGRDNRSSSKFLSEAALEGIRALNGEATDFGLVTTPQLHYVVCCNNYNSYGKPTIQGYYEKLSNAFEALMIDYQKSTNYSPKLYIDGANGVGALKMLEMKDYLKSLEINIFNDATSGKLNHKCGADYVKVGQIPPEGCKLIPGERYASFDGDADRIVYFYASADKKFHLLDGDKIAALIAKFLQELISTLQLTLQIGVVQTAYANGSSTEYIQDKLNIPVICMPTGVKHLHNEAMKYDVGIYFEANGHGTVVFSESAKIQIRELASDMNTENTKQGTAKKLLSAIDIINETVGDAISDLLLIEAILHDCHWSIADWDSMYTDLPNRQLKIKVPDRKAIETTDAGRKCVKPEGLQKEIDNIVSAYKHGRAFVRPSGTEDIVRVYAEADSQDAADDLATKVAELVQKYAK